MKKIFFLCSVFLFSVPLAFALASELKVVDKDGNAKSQFNGDEDVYVVGTCDPASNESIYLYILEDRDEWPLDTGLSDISGGIETKAQGEAMLAEGALAVQMDVGLWKGAD